MRMRWVLLGALIVGASGCAGDEGAAVTIRAFELERAEPPADLRGELPVVGPQSDLHLRWELEGKAARLELALNERPVARFDRGTLPAAHAERCEDEACATERIGELTWRLRATDADGRSDERILRVRVAEQGLQVLAFTSAPDTVEPGTSVLLSWQTTGAERAELVAAPIGGGPARPLGTFEGAEAVSGSFTDEAVEESTIYTLTVEDEAGRSATATVTVTLGGEAWLTSIAATPDRPSPGEPVTLSWTSTGLERLTIVRDDGHPSITDIEQEELEEGEREVTLSRTTTFTFVGISRDGQVITERCDETGCVPARLRIEVVPGPTVHSFTASEGEIASGSSALLHWNVSDADTIGIDTLSDGGTGSLEVQPGMDTLEIVPEDTTRYTLVATGSGRTISRALVVGVRPAVELHAPGTVAPGASFQVRWQTRGADLLELAFDGRPVDLQGKAVEGDSVDLRMAQSAQPGSTVELVLTARDDETPRRQGQARLQIAVDDL